MQECLRICFQETLMDTCDCYHPAFLSHTTSYWEEELCELEVTDRKEDQGGFQLLDLIITKLKSHMTC